MARRRKKLCAPAARPRRWSASSASCRGTARNPRSAQSVPLHRLTAAWQTPAMRRWLEDKGACQVGNGGGGAAPASGRCSAEPGARLEQRHLRKPDPARRRADLPQARSGKSNASAFTALARGETSRQPGRISPRCPRLSSCATPPVPAPRCCPRTRLPGLTHAHTPVHPSHAPGYGGD